MKKRTSIALSTLLLAGGISTTIQTANAAENSTVSTASSDGISKELMDKADQYIKVSKDGFSISANDLRNFTFKQQSQIIHELHLTNEALKESNLSSASVDTNAKTISVEIDENSSSTSVSTRATATASKKYIKVTFKPWGAQVYFSHKAVNDLNDYFAISGIAAGLGAGAALGKFLAKNGVKLAVRFLGPVSLYGSTIAWGMSKVDKGKGVNLNCILYVPATITAA